MINIYEVTETNKMVEKENLDVRTITLGINLLDCASENLDEVNEKIVIDILTQLHKEGSTIIVVTHDLEVGDVAERKIILEYGKIVDVVDQKQYGKKK